MPVKSTKIFLGALNGKNVYTMGAYAEDVRDIIMSQAKEIKELRANLKTAEGSKFDHKWSGEYVGKND